MSVTAKIEDGKVVQSASATSLANSTVKDKSTLDKDAFLGLLVAQMKYQDPLEPTSNTEFVAQYAQFSSLEQMQNMSATLELSRASTLVGQIVSVNTKNSSGQTTQIQGKVDYIIYENNKAYVSIGDALYSLNDVYGVADQEYLKAYDLATNFMVKMAKLPSSKEKLTLDNKTAIDELNEIYNGMSDYQKSFISSATVTTLKGYTERIAELVKEQEANNAASNNGGDSDGGN
ncbi:flagellar basal-body rod modification protein FlgD [Kineothrix alysoides]|uniref:Basal-body rod modification protein FlgD n=1 Tax=Kineothrix alysoides TaxID=1469948 RepID=A0A4R1QU40_9FIRM|nr:flagellar hook capping FlgD N-terminal domain-containing protein [Kineothrix alysoides]TCL56591.1 flagellar basal-body rod modification protein FlgD [Kineothrix alysoides]